MFDTGRDLVECHSGFRYGEKPVVVCWQGRRLTVSKVISIRIPPPDGVIVWKLKEEKFSIWNTWNLKMFGG